MRRRPGHSREDRQREPGALAPLRRDRRRHVFDPAGGSRNVAGERCRGTRNPSPGPKFGCVASKSSASSSWPTYARIKLAMSRGRLERDCRSPGRRRPGVSARERSSLRTSPGCRSNLPPWRDSSPRPVPPPLFQLELVEVGQTLGERGALALVQRELERGQAEDRALQRSEERRVGKECRL